MCGIITMMSTEALTNSRNRAKFFQEGVLVDTLRGSHSTGVLAVGDDKDDVACFKKAIPGYDFIHLPNFSRLRTNFDKVKFAVAHNRHATKGAINAINAHPFTHGSVTGVHNGSLWAYKHLAQGEPFDTDSEHVIHSLAYKGTEATVENLDGAFVLVWHNSEDNTLHYIRNSERPFHLAYIKDQNTVVGASEKLMLKMLCERAELPIEKLYQLKVGREYVFKLDNLKNPTEIDRKLYAPKPVVTGNFQNGGARTNTQETSIITGADAQKARRRSKVLLNQYGLKVDDRVEFWVNRWVPYNNSQHNIYGQLIGSVAKSPYHDIVINGITRDVYDAMDNWYCSAKIISSTVDTRNNLTIVLSGQSMIELNDDDAEDDTKSEVIEVSSDDNPFDDTDLMDTALQKMIDGMNQPTEDVPSWPKTFWKQGRRLKAKAASSLISNGCSMCGIKLRLSKFDELTWIDDDPVCPKCAASFV